MARSILSDKKTKLFLILGAFFITNALMAQFIGVKIFSLEKILGIEPMNWTFMGQDGLSFNLTAGVLLWPVVFVLTDIINEYYGIRGVRFLSFLAVAMIAFASLVVVLGINLPPADFWITTKANDGVENYNNAYRAVLGQGAWIILGSMIAFLIGQVIDVRIFHFIKKITGEKMLWLRATGSTVISQLIDSFVVLIIAFYFGADWPIKLVMAIAIINFIYKFTVAVILTPTIYLAHNRIDNYLGEEVAEQLKQEAHE